MSYKEFMADVKQMLIEDGKVTKELFDYLDDIIQDIVSDKLSQSVENMREQLLEELKHARSR